MKLNLPLPLEYVKMNVHIKFMIRTNYDRPMNPMFHTFVEIG